MSKLESKYQSQLIVRIEQRFPGCLVMKNDEQHRQGIPDLTVLWRNRWAVLEVKKSENEPYQPNQEHYLDRLGQMSYSATIYPSNEDEVLNALQQSFESGGNTRDALSK